VNANNGRGDADDLDSALTTVFLFKAFKRHHKFKDSHSQTEDDVR